MLELLDQKADKQAMITICNQKSQKSDVEMQLNQKVDLEELDKLL